MEMQTAIFNGFTIAGIIIGSLLILIMLDVSSKYVSRWIALWLFAIVVHQLFFFVNLNNLVSNKHWILLLGFPWAMVHLPLFYLNIKTITGKPISRLEVFLHFLPYSLYVLVILSYYLSVGNMYVENGFLHFDHSSSKLLRSFNGIPIAISAITYIALCYIRLHRYKKEIKNFYSFSEGVSLSWIRNLVWFVIAFVIIIFALIEFSVRVDWFTTVGFKWVSIVLTLFTAYYGFKYYKQLLISNALSPLVNTNEDSKKYQHSTLSTDEMKYIFDKVMKVLKEKSLHLDEELTLSQLAFEAGVSQAKISETFSRYKNSSFYDLINALRIDEVKKLLESSGSERYSVEGIGFQCGFKSKSTFYKFFKRETGMTPSQYRKTFAKKA